MSNLLAWEHEPCNCVQCKLGPNSDKLLDVLRWAAQGLKVNETADVMNYSLPSIKRWRGQVVESLGATNITHATAIAIREGLI